MTRLLLQKSLTEVTEVSEKKGDAILRVLCALCERLPFVVIEEDEDSVSGRRRS